MIHVVREGIQGMNNIVGSVVNNWQPPECSLREKMQGRFCRLEPLHPAQHSKELYDAYALDPHGHLWTYLPYGPFTTRDDYEVWLTDVCKKTDPQFHAIIDLKSNTAVGVASYLRISPEAGSIEVGHLCFSPLLQATVAATEAMYLMMKKVFDAGYRRYEWKCNALNDHSRQAAKRLGFSYEGIFRQAAVVKGRNRDTAWFSIIDTEWPHLKSGFEEWLSPTNFDDNGVQKHKLHHADRG